MSTACLAPGPVCSVTELPRVISAISASLLAELNGGFIDALMGDGAVAQKSFRHKRWRGRQQ